VDGQGAQAFTDFPHRRSTRVPRNAVKFHAGCGRFSQ
jgi:hypothetical protein